MIKNTSTEEFCFGENGAFIRLHPKYGQGDEGDTAHRTYSLIFLAGVRFKFNGFDGESLDNWAKHLELVNEKLIGIDGLGRRSYPHLDVVTVHDWYYNWDRGSRDMYMALLPALAIGNQYGVDTKTTKRVLKSFRGRAFLFASNWYKNWRYKKKEKHEDIQRIMKTNVPWQRWPQIPDLLGFESWAVLMRTHGSKWWIPLLFFCDIMLWINTLWTNRFGGSDVNSFMNKLILSWAIHPTFFSYLALKHFDREKVMARFKEYYDNPASPWFIYQMYVETLDLMGLKNEGF